MLDKSCFTHEPLEDEPGPFSLLKRLKMRTNARQKMVHKDSMIEAEYGDIFEMVDNENAMIASMQQR